MILLEHANRILLEYCQDRAVNPEKKQIDEITIADFDGVTFHITSAGQANQSTVLFSISWACMGELAQYGATADLKKIYGPFLQAQAEQGYDASLVVDFAALNDQQRNQLPLKISNFKRHCIAAPFKAAFQSVVENSASGDIQKIRFKEGEAVYIIPKAESCTVIFEVAFFDPDDAIFAKVFLQEFADARKSMRGVPSVTYNYKEAPLELEGADLEDVDNNGFVSFVLFENHICAKNVFKTINLIHTFRDYLHYHIKCSKAFMHNRMRSRVADWIQVLNRSRPESFEEKKKKTFAGKSFQKK
jgi:actin related protein 2/3 complex subunit 2